MKRGAVMRREAGRLGSAGFGRRLGWLGAMVWGAAIFGVTVFGAAVFASCGHPHNALSRAEAAEGWTLLFNGRDLDGWRPSGTELFYVDADGNLVLESGPDAQYGFLSTTEFFDDFDCIFEFNQMANGNSGFFFRSVLPESTDPCWQVEIAPRGLWSGGIYESYGRGWLSQPAEEYLAEGWNRMRVRVVGDNARVWLNDVLVTFLTDPALLGGRGGIVLQIHDGGGIKVAFRDMKLKKL